MISGTSLPAKAMANKLGAYLKKRRLAAKLSQFEVSEKLGYSSAQFVSNIERGCCFPPMEALKTMMSLYNISGSEMTKLLSTLQTAYFKEEFSLVGKKAST